MKEKQPSKKLPVGTQKLDQSDAGRRKLLKAVAAGGGVAAGLKGLPPEWKKPMVDAVLLPAHAAASLEDPCSIICEIRGRYTFQVIINGEVIGGVGGEKVKLGLQYRQGGCNGTIIDGIGTVTVMTVPGGPGSVYTLDYDVTDCQTIPGADTITVLAELLDADGNVVDSGVCCEPLCKLKCSNPF